MSNLDKLQQINTNVPRETNVHEADGLIIKRPNNASDAKLQTLWVEKQKFAQKIQDFLRAKQNPAYFVPHMLEVSGAQVFAIEERVPGHPLVSSFVEQLSKEDMDVIYRGLANFMKDMATYMPVLSQSEYFDSAAIAENDKKFTFAYVLNHINKYLHKPEIDLLKKAKALFDTESLNDASVVFSHGDMNEHNVFYDPNTKTISVIDVADAKYENANEMFYRNFARLDWLDIERLISEFNTLSHERPIKIATNKYLASLRNALHSFKWSAIEILKNPKHVNNVRVQMLQEDFKHVVQTYNAAKMHFTQKELGVINRAETIKNTLPGTQKLK